MSRNIVGLCAGNGVMIHPFIGDLLCNIEPRGIFFDKANTQWKLNFGDTPLFKQADFAILHAKNLLGNGKGLLAIIGHPDCGDSSMLRFSRAKKMGKPKENPSLNLYLKGVNLLKPQFFFMENLPALLKTYSVDSFNDVFERDYRIKAIEAPVSKFGNSQIHRKRLLLIGIRKDISKEADKIFNRGFHSKDKPLAKCGELLEGLYEMGPDPDFGHVRERDDEVITLYSQFKAEVGWIKNQWVKKHKGLKRWPVTDRNFTTAPGIYRNLDDDFPATARKQNRQFNQLGEMMSPRELARIQGIPDSFYIHIDDSDYQKLKYWINKGRVSVTKCPPYEMGLWIQSRLRKVLKNKLA